jgi:hypothetical protein
MLKRRLNQAGLPGRLFASLVPGDRNTDFLENDCTLEAAQRIAGRADSRTTKLYDRRGQKVLLEDMESSLPFQSSLARRAGSSRLREALAGVSSQPS